MKRYLFIINPIAGGGKTKKLESIIRDTMDENNLEYEIIFTYEKKSAIDIARDCKYDIVVAVGGDGTINEVVTGIIDRKNVSLGIIPAGTGNDFSKSLKIPADPREALDLIITGSTRRFTVPKVNENYFINIASLGFDVEVTKNIDIFRKLIKGDSSYILSVIYTLIKYKKKRLVLEMDGIRKEHNLFLIAIGKGNYYGGGMMILPSGDLSDDHLSVCLIKDIKNIKALLLFPSIFKGEHVKYTKYVEMHKAKEIKYLDTPPIYLNIDGEVIEQGGEITFSLSDKEIRIIC